MTNTEKIIQKLNELIKINIQTIQIWKNGNYEYKHQEIEYCKESIQFYKNQKKRFQNNLIK
jgi:hypothetical protein